MSSSVVARPMSRWSPRRSGIRWSGTLRIIAILVIAPLVSGCWGNAIPSLRQPDRLYTIDEELARVRAAEPAALERYIRFESVQARNDYITVRMFIVDVEYTKYESQLTHESQDINFLATATSLGLTTTAALIPVAQTSRLLSGIATGVTGLDAAYNEKILLTKAVQNVQTQMRANRNEQAAIILANMKCSVEEYPIGMALSDLETYYRAGTFTAGLIALSGTVSKAESDAKAQKDSQIPSAPAAAKAKINMNAVVAAAERNRTSNCVTRGKQMSPS
jgi:hypothetical protein